MIATDKSQSGRLLRCGVSADTADMYISNYGDLWASPFKDNQRKDEKGFTPAWSLSALLTTVLPSNIRYKGHTSLLEITSSNWQSDEQIWEVAYDIDLGVEAPDPIGQLIHEPTMSRMSVYKPISRFKRLMLRWSFGLKFEKI